MFLYLLCDEINQMERRQNIRDQGVRRRQWGLTIVERIAENNLWTTIVALLTVIAALPPGHAFINRLMGIIVVLIIAATSLREQIIQTLDPIDPTNKNRGFDSWTDETSYRDLRFHKVLLLLFYYPTTYHLLIPTTYYLPPNYITDSCITVGGFAYHAR